jgi:hypothetical protein
MQLKKFREKVDAEDEREEYIRKLEINAKKFMPKLIDPPIKMTKTQSPNAR